MTDSVEACYGLDEHDEDGNWRTSLRSHELSAEQDSVGSAPWLAGDGHIRNAHLGQ